MKTMVYDGKLYWMVTGISAVRPKRSDSFDRLEILNIDQTTGEIQYKSRTVSPMLFKTVKSVFKEAGLS